MNKKAERADTRHLQRLLEGLNAREQFITADQLTRFCNRPAGLIMPELCLEAKRLPESYGKRNDGHTSSRPIECLSVTPDGTPCFITDIGERIVCAYGDKLYDLGHESYSMYGWHKEILGFASTQDRPVPIVKVSLIYNVSDYNGNDDELTAGRTARIFIGDTLALDETGVVAQTVSSEGITYAKMDKDGKCHILCNGKIMTEKSIRRFLKLLEIENGSLYAVWQMKEHPNRFYFGVPMATSPYEFTRQTVDVVNTRKGVGIITNDDASCRLYNPWVKEARNLGDVRYVSGFTELSETFAYIGAGKYGRCWVINGETQPGFDEVSLFFEREGRRLYYGVNGRHLYTMTVPDLKP